LSKLHFVETVFHLILGFGYLAALGYPLVKLTLPKDYYQPYGRLLVYPVGYLMLCLGGFSLSGSTGMSTINAVLIVSGVLATFTAILLIRQSTSLEVFIETIRGGVGQALKLSGPMFLIMLWPMFIFGADTYLGAVNPDYFAGFVDNYFLSQGHSVADFTRGSDTQFPFDYLAGSISSSGRFASGLVAISLETLFGLSAREALTISITLFLACLPITIYFFSRTVFGLSERVSKISAWLTCISGPVTLSYLYFYLGQNSGLAALPLVLALGFLTLNRPDLKLLVLFSLLANALFVTYLGMLPYAIAPLGALGFYLLITKRITLIRLLALIVGTLLVSVSVNFAMLPELYAMVSGWGNVIGQTLQGQYFLDFLTEMFFPLYLGVTVYPLNSSWIDLLIGQYGSHLLVLSPLILVGLLLFSMCRWRDRQVEIGYRALTVVSLVMLYMIIWVICNMNRAYFALVVLAITLIVGSFILLSMFYWARENMRDHSRLVTVSSAVVIYVIVWWFYSFERQYGYAVFKMASWLQFMLVPFVAYGISLRFDSGGSFTRTIKNRAIACCAVLYVATNLNTTFEYGFKGMGRDVSNGYIVNNFEMSGNRDYFELNEAIKKYVGPDESVGISFVNSIQNFWVSYYLRDHPISILSHENIPGDDENLPDILTNKVVDYYGNVREANNVFFHGATDDYFLTWNVSHVNKDIATTRFMTSPVWENSTFRLFQAADNPDIVFTGRGYYRAEYLDGDKPYWWPETMRWTAQGGEVYLLRPSALGEKYYLTFDVIVGLELPSDSRHIELWANGVKFDEFKVDSAARYISKPFVPTEQVVKLVIKIKETVSPMKRPLPIWNDDIPTDYRQLNVALSNISVAPVSQFQQIDKCGMTLSGDEILRCALSFNGIQVDRWIGDKAQIDLDVSEFGDASELVLKGLAPGNLNFTYPLEVKFSIDGNQSVQLIDSPGEFSLVFPLREQKAGQVIRFEIDPSQVHDLTEQFTLRRKLVRQSLKIDALMIK
jgi:hypothetical protein